MPNETKNYGTVITTAGAALIAKCILNGGTMVWKRPAAGKESVPLFTTATRTHHMSVAATRT